MAKTTETKSFMEKAAAFIVNRRHLILVLTLAMLVFSGFSFSWVELQEDITYYLQDTAEAKRGLKIMNEEFVTYATARVMAEDISREEALALAEKIEALKGVILVDYEDDSEHYKDGCALYSVTFEGVGNSTMAASDGSDRRAYEAMDRLTALLEDYNTTVYSDSFASLNDIIAKEMLGVLGIVIIVVLGVLLFTSSSYGEILVLVSTFIVAAVINMGTNFILGTMSFIGYTVAVVLQLALSVDYAIILCNRYKEEHRTLPVNEAVISALAKSIPSISASSLTTIAGLTAMTFMQFRLGLDLGIALIKAIAVSLLSVFVFMPVMLCYCGKLIDRTKHRNFVPKVSFMGSFAYKTRYVIPFIFLALVIVGYVGSTHSNYGYSMDSIETAHKNEQDLALEKIEDKFGKSNLLVAMIPAGDYEKEAAFSEELLSCREVKSILGLASVEAMNGYRLADEVDYRGIMDVADVDETMAKALITFCAADRGEYREVSEDLEGYKIPLVDMFLSLYNAVDSGKTGQFSLSPAQTDMIYDLYSQLHMAQEQLQGENYSRILIYIDLPDQGEETFRFLERIHTIAEQYYEEGVVLTGNSVSAKDFNDTFERDYRVVTLLSVVLVLVILFFTFRSLGMPLLLIFVIQGSIWLNFALPAVTGVNVFFMCFLIVSAIQMGANIDYAIVISSRYTELREQGMEQREAITETLNLAFPTVITSGLMMVAAGSLVGARVSQCVIAGMGKYVGIGTSISLVLVNFALPQVLLLGDGFARATRIRLLPAAAGKKSRSAWSSFVAYALALSSLAVLIAAPVSMNRAGKALKAEKRDAQELSEYAVGLRELASEIDRLEETNPDVNMDFAEHLLTDKIGTEQLDEGLAEYEAGEATLEEYKALLADGEEQYRAGYEEYTEGLAKYEAGKAQIAAAQAQYDAGVAAYEEGKKKLAEGQAEYDAGLAEYEQGKQTLQLGESLLATVQPVYQLVMPLYESYLSVQSRYDELAASGASEIQLAIVRTEVAAAKALFETNLVGFSIGGLMESMQSAQAQIAEGEAALAEAQAQLDAGKAELDAGYAQLADAEEQLAYGEKGLTDGYAQLRDAEKQLEDGWAELEAARKELDDGAKQIRDGENELISAEEQINEGRETLERNRAELMNDLGALDEISDDRERLKSGVRLLKTDAELAETGEKAATDGEFCSAAVRTLDARQKKLDTASGLLKLSAAAMMAAALAACLCLYLWLKGKYAPAAAAALLGLAVSVLSAVVWRAEGIGGTMLLLLPAIALAVMSAAAADMLIKKNKNGQ